MRPNSLLTAACAALIAFIPSCTTRDPYRALEKGKVVKDYVDQNKYLGPYVPNDQDIRRMAHALDSRRANECLEKYGDDSRNHGSGAFWLAHVEMKDYGSYHDHRQLDVVERAVEADLKTDRSLFHNGATIVVFVHGWFNNADEQNGNLRDFRDLLYKTAQEERGMGRGVIGIYVSWRGGTLMTPPLSFLTFWGRKRAATDIGHGSMVEMLARIKNLEWLVSRGGKPSSNPPTGAYKNCRLVLVGHSFGAAALFSAVHHSLEAKFQEPYWDFRRYGRTSPESARSMPLVLGYGDLVLLINPAFEALPYRSLHYAMSSNAVVTYAPNQPVLMMILSSKNDWPNHIALPVGQALGNRGMDYLARKEDRMEAEQHHTAVGHDGPFQSHTLTLEGADKHLVLRRNPAYFAFGIDHNEDEVKYNPPKPIVTLSQRYDFKGRITTPAITQKEIDAVPAPETGSAKSLNEPRQQPTRLSSAQLTGPGLLPFMVVSVDPRIIDGHSGFWPNGGKHAALDFVSTFILAQNYAVTGARTAESERAVQQHSIAR